MTYNLKFASTSAPNAWPVRRPIMREVFRQIAPQLIGSNTWRTKWPRMVTRVNFLDRQAKQEFQLWNTHSDNDLQTARE